jgi:hypothetical protein
MDVMLSSCLDVCELCPACSDGSKSLPNGLSKRALLRDVVGSHLSILRYAQITADGIGDKI